LRTSTPTDFPSAIWSKNWFLRRMDMQRSTGVCGQDPERSLGLKELLDEKIGNSSVGFPATTLGL
jgi:hypothetical protein